MQFSTYSSRALFSKGDVDDCAIICRNISSLAIKFSAFFSELSFKNSVSSKRGFLSSPLHVASFILLARSVLLFNFAFASSRSFVASLCVRSMCFKINSYISIAFVSLFNFKCALAPLSKAFSYFESSFNAMSQSSAAIAYLSNFNAQNALFAKYTAFFGSNLIASVYASNACSYSIL